MSTAKTIPWCGVALCHMVGPLHNPVENRKEHALYSSFCEIDDWFPNIVALVLSGQW